MSKLLKLWFFIVNYSLASSQTVTETGFRILDGHTADKKHWPFIAVITCGQIHHCGGTLIKPNWIVTAGHCVTGRAFKKQEECLGNLSVRIGPEDLQYVHIKDYLKPDCQNISLKKIIFSAVIETQIVPIIKAVPHPDYFLEQYEVDDAPVEIVSYDIALLQLSKSFPEHLVARLPTKSIFKTSICQVAGWGLRGTIPPKPGSINDLQEINITIMSDDVCKELVESIYNILPFTLPPEKEEACEKNVVCGDGQTSIQSILSGDSGGPLICDNELHGVASLVLLKENKNDSKLSYSGVYSEVSNYVSWIHEVTSHGDKDKDRPAETVADFKLFKYPTLPSDFGFAEAYSGFDLSDPSSTPLNGRSEGQKNRNYLIILIFASGINIFL